eukprot:gnl/Chilomastix_cuspidata/9448.p1 GENE.gnl/Chilomastix_cuspidata/9448~~gnl/Chilomastix_cuspidata/9448.p1  ORF type:complete len:243 (+),score=84.39 gnl/Chilomastix_cuspidata/9448:714-1442(+)
MDFDNANAIYELYFDEELGAYTAGDVALELDTGYNIFTLFPLPITDIVEFHYSLEARQDVRTVATDKGQTLVSVLDVGMSGYCMYGGYIEYGDADVTLDSVSYKLGTMFDDSQLTDNIHIQFTPREDYISGLCVPEPGDREPPFFQEFWIYLPELKIEPEYYRKASFTLFIGEFVVFIIVVKTVILTIIGAIPHIMMCAKATFMFCKNKWKRRANPINHMLRFQFSPHDEGRVIQTARPFPE